MRKIILASIILIALIATQLWAEPTALMEKTTLTIDELPISTVLSMIAEEHGLDIVISGDALANISIRLEDVTVQDALDAILIANGYNYYLKGDILIIKPFQMDILGETVSKAIELDNIGPSAAINAAQDLLSPKGKMKVIGGSNMADFQFSKRTPTMISITDLPDIVDHVISFIRSIDIQEEQMSIHVKIIETNVSSENRIGFDWPTSLSARFKGISNQSNTGTSGSSSSETEALAQIDLPDGKWEWGTLSVDEVSIVLDFLEQNGNSRLVSDPRITALDNHESEIKVTTIVPIQTINRFSEGGATQDIVTFQDEEVGITLQVMPHISRDGSILLDVNPVIAEIVGYSGPVDNQKPITSERSIRTKIKVKNGETAVLGGLLKENEIESEQKVKFLGSIPILGHLFRHKTVEKSATDLLILITPTILTD